MLHGQYVRIVDRELFGGEGKMLHGQYIRSLDRRLVGG